MFVNSVLLLCTVEAIVGLPMLMTFVVYLAR
jgi:hypothetical protein